MKQLSDSDKFLLNFLDEMHRPVYQQLSINAINKNEKSIFLDDEVKKKIAKGFTDVLIATIIADMASAGGYDTTELDDKSMQLRVDFLSSLVDFIVNKEIE